MYLAGLGATGVSVADCRAAGGVPSYSGGNCSGSGIGYTCSEGWYSCIFPPAGATRAAPAPAPAPAPVTVNTNTQVSPQISPQFVQQDKPTNSPVSANPAQDQSTGTPTGAGANDSTAALIELLANAMRPPAMAVPTTTGYTDAGQSLTLPTPLGPASVSVSTLEKYAPWIAAILISGAVLYSKRRN